MTTHDRAQAEGYDPERDEWAQTYRDTGYEWCRPCKEWHRPPECWIDPNGQPQLDIDSDREERA